MQKIFVKKITDKEEPMNNNYVSEEKKGKD